MKYQIDNQVVLISGGSQGLGREFARKYYKDSNSTVIIVSRSEAKLLKAAKEIVNTDKYLDLKDAKGGCRFMYHSCDVSDITQVENMFDILKAKCIEITQVFCCAGGAIPKLLSDLSGAELSAGIITNYNTALNLTHVSLKNNVKHLILFSSCTAVYPFIGYSQYAPSKAAIRSLVAILRQEFPNTRVSCVYPGNFDSEGYEEEKLTKPDICYIIEGPSNNISCEECCAKIINFLKRGYDDITTDFIGWLLFACSMGFNTHSTKYFMWPLGWLLGSFFNFFIIPIYMITCTLSIKNWRKKVNGQQNKKE